MATITPPSKPKLTEAAVRAALEAELIRLGTGLGTGVNLELLLKECPVIVFAIRGYYRDSMGEPNVNDAGLNDDACFIVTPDKVIPYNWNTDPSVIGWNAALGKPYAMLKEGIWPFIKGMHKGRVKAWRQPDPEQARKLKLERFFDDSRKLGYFTVIRDPGRSNRGSRYLDSGYHAINIHDGVEHGTSSWGCQTAPPRQYPDFQQRSYELTSGQAWLPYVLTDTRIG